MGFTICLVLCGAIAAPVSAIDKNDLNSISNGTPFYDPTQQGCFGGNGVTLTGSDNKQKIFNYFVQNGFSPEQAAGIIGNIQVESGGDPQIYQGDGKDHEYPPSTTDMLGWGIVQWTPPSKITTYAKTESENPALLSTQVEFLLKQLNGTAPNSNEKAAGDLLKAVNVGITVNGKPESVAWHASQVFLMAYERAADHAPDGPNAFNRGSAADDALKQYGSPSQSNPSTTDSSAETSSCGIPAGQCNIPIPAGGYDAIKAALLTNFKIDLGGDKNVNWADEEYNTVCTLAKAPAYYSKLTADGPIAVTLHTGDGCGGGHSGNNGKDPYGVSLTGYCTGFDTAKDYNRFLLAHELGHMYNFRNQSVYNLFDSTVWGHSSTLPTYNCQHDYDNPSTGEHGPYEAECWADMIGEYLVWFDIRATVGGVPTGTKDFKQYERSYGAYWNFARDHLFGGIIFTKF